MVTYILILFAHVGGLVDESNALTAVPGFTVEKECIDAGESAKKIANTLTRKLDYACVKQTRDAP